MKKCNFDSKSSKDILEQLSLKTKAANNTEAYTKLVTETRKNYNNIEIEYLLQNYEIKNKHYTDESIKNFVTLFIAIGAFAISVLKETHDIPSVNIVFFITLVASIIVIALRAFSPKGSELNDAIFLLKQAKELEESSKEVNKDS